MQLDPVRLWRAAKPLIPTRFHRYAALPYRVWVRALCWYHEQLPDAPGADGLPLPPARLRHRVIGVADAESFRASIPKVRADFDAALRRIGRNLGDHRCILDFGAGCGRGLRSFAGPEHVQLFGTDIDAEAIAWCRANLPFAQWSVNGELPPLPFGDGQFDLLYSISVLTHLDEQHQLAWLAEWKRITRPGAILLVTVHGRDSWRNLPRDVRQVIERDGFLYLPSYADKGRFPDWYQNAYHTEQYVRRTFASYFDVLDYQPSALYAQDLVVLERRND